MLQKRNSCRGDILAIGIDRGEALRSKSILGDTRTLCMDYYDNCALISLGEVFFRTCWGDLRKDFEVKLEVKRKAFGEKVVFEDRIFRVYGRRTLIKGPSGSGKTTLLRMLSLLDDDYEGTYSGKPRSPLVLFQEDRLSERISVLSNLLAVTKDRSKAMEMLERLSLSGEERSCIRELSGGMKRRVAIARVLLLDSDFLFLDEPFRGLDDDMRSSVAMLVSEYAASKTLVLVTHDEEDLRLLRIGNEIRLG